jgi:hypothetical protein
MRSYLKLFVLVLAGPILVASAANKTLVSDPLTGLPIVSWPDRLNLGNDPTRLPETTICKSKMQSDFYSPNGINVAATVAWYTSKLSGFKKTHTYANNRSQDTFYKSEGTVIVSITGSRGSDGEDTEVQGIVYATFQPALSEKAVVGMSSQKIVCQ